MRGVDKLTLTIAQLVWTLLWVFAVYLTARDLFGVDSGLTGMAGGIIAWATWAFHWHLVDLERVNQHLMDSELRRLTEQGEL